MSRLQHLALTVCSRLSLMREVSRVLILKKSQMFSEEVRCILQDSGLCLRSCIYQDHLGHIDRVCPIRLFSEEPFVDIERLEVN